MMILMYLRMWIGLLLWWQHRNWMPLLLLVRVDLLKVILDLLWMSISFVNYLFIFSLCTFKLISFGFARHIVILYVTLGP